MCPPPALVIVDDDLMTLNGLANTTTDPEAIVIASQKLGAAFAK